MTRAFGISVALIAGMFWASSGIAQEILETPLAPAPEQLEEGEGDGRFVPNYGDIVEPPTAEQVASASFARLRVLDKITGAVSDVDVPSGGEVGVGLITIRSVDCRYPVDNPSGNAYAGLIVTYRDVSEPVFEGWMIAAAPALNAMDHPRYDVWVLGCTIS